MPAWAGSLNIFLHWNWRCSISSSVEIKICYDFADGKLWNSWQTEYLNRHSVKKPIFLLPKQIMKNSRRQWDKSLKNRIKTNRKVWTAADDVVPYRPFNKVRWTLSHLAIKEWIRNYKPLIQFFSKEVEDGNDPAAKYCLTILQNP